MLGRALKWVTGRTRIRFAIAELGLEQDIYTLYLRVGWTLWLFRNTLANERKAKTQMELERELWNALVGRGEEPEIRELADIALIFPAFQLPSGSCGSAISAVQNLTAAFTKFLHTTISSSFRGA